MMRTFEGCWPALLTPYTPQDDVNVEVLRALVDHLLARGVSGFYVCGSTGEGPLQTVQERILVTETVLDQVAGRVPVIVHVGAAALKDARRLAEHARSAGAAGVSSILPPVLYDAHGIVPFFEAIAAAAAELPFLSYLFGSSRDAAALMRDLGHIPNLAGTKYTGPNMYEMNQLVRFRSDGWTVFSGMDEQAALARMYGAAGCIGSTLNIMPGVYREIYASLAAGDAPRALDLQQRANRVTGLLLDIGFAAALREALRVLGFDCGRPRLPNVPAAEAQLAALRAGLHEAGFAELAAL